MKKLLILVSLVLIFNIIGCDQENKESSIVYKDNKEITSDISSDEKIVDDIDTKESLETNVQPDDEKDEKAETDNTNQELDNFFVEVPSVEIEVVDAVNYEKKVQVQTDAGPYEWTYTIRLPEITSETENAKQFNKKLYDTFGKEYELLINDQQDRQIFMSDYTYKKHNGILGIVITTTYGAYNGGISDFYHAFYYDTKNGKELSFEEYLVALGLTGEGLWTSIKNTTEYSNSYSYISPYNDVYLMDAILDNIGAIVYLNDIETMVGWNKLEVEYEFIPEENDINITLMSNSKIVLPSEYYTLTGIKGNVDGVSYLQAELIKDLSNTQKGIIFYVKEFDKTLVTDKEVFDKLAAISEAYDKSYYLDMGESAQNILEIIKKLELKNSIASMAGTLSKIALEAGVSAATANTTSILSAMRTLGTEAVEAMGEELSESVITELGDVGFLVTTKKILITTFYAELCTNSCNQIKEIINKPYMTYEDAEKICRLVTTADTSYKVLLLLTMDDIKEQASSSLLKEIEGAVSKVSESVFKNLIEVFIPEKVVGILDKNLDAASKILKILEQQKAMLEYYSDCGGEEYQEIYDDYYILNSGNIIEANTSDYRHNYDFYDFINDAYELGLLSEESNVEESDAEESYFSGRFSQYHDGSYTIFVKNVDLSNMEITIEYIITFDDGYSALSSVETFDLYRTNGGEIGFAIPYTRSIVVRFDVVFFYDSNKGIYTH